MTMHQKVDVIFFKHMSKKENFERKRERKRKKTILLSSSSLPLRKNSLGNHNNNISLPQALSFFY